VGEKKDRKKNEGRSGKKERKEKIKDNIYIYICIYIYIYIRETRGGEEKGKKEKKEDGFRRVEERGY